MLYQGAVRSGLAGAGLCDAKDVSAGHGDGDGLGLDGRGGRVAGRFDGGEDFAAEPELSKGGGMQK